MRWLPAVALGVICAAASPVLAQRGGGGHGGGGFGGGGHAMGGGGFGGHMSGGGFGGHAATPAGGFGGGGARPGFSGTRFSGTVGRPGFGSARGFGGGVRPSVARPGFYNRGGYAGGAIGGNGAYRGRGYGSGRGYGYGRGYGRGYGFGYGYPVYGYPVFAGIGLWDPFLDFSDYGDFEGGGFDGPGDAYYGSPTAEAYPAGGYSAPQGYDQAPPPAGYDQAPPPAGYGQQDPGGYPQPAPSGYGAGDYAQRPSDGGPMVYAPGMYRGGGSGSVLRPAVQETPVTVYFRDGRPPEQIRNYALTRTSLLIPGQTMREIPLADVDLPTTERVNRAAGIDFQLP